MSSHGAACGRSDAEALSERELERIFPGDSELAGLMRGLDWSKTDLGDPRCWSESWRTAVRLCLTSRIPVVMYLGPNFTVLYNDPYISFLGKTKHPRYLGQPGQECWREIWDTIGPMLESVHQTGKATWSEDVQMYFARNLPLEEVYVRFTFGPILAVDGRKVEGIFCPCTETTEQVVGARRLDTAALASRPSPLLLELRQARLEVGRLHRLDVALDELAEFGRFRGREVAGRIHTTSSADQGRPLPIAALASSTRSTGGEDEVSMV